MNVGSYIGNIGKIGEVTKTKQAIPQDMLRFSIAVETNVKNKPLWVSVLCFGDQIAVAKKLTVGSKVFVCGNQNISLYNGEPSVSIVCSLINVVFSAKADRTGTTGAAPNKPASKPDPAPDDTSDLPF